MNEINPKFKIGLYVFASSNEGEIIGHCFYDNQLFYIVDTKGNFLDEDIIYVTESEINKIVERNNYELPHKVGEKFNEKGAIICGILIRKQKASYYIDYPDFPSEFICWDFWDNWK